jgi:hypothetical protein
MKNLFNLIMHHTTELRDRKVVLVLLANKVDECHGITVDRASVLRFLATANPDADTNAPAFWHVWGGEASNWHNNSSFLFQTVSAIDPNNDGINDVQETLAAELERIGCVAADARVLTRRTASDEWRTVAAKELVPGEFVCDGDLSACGTRVLFVRHAALPRCGLVLHIEHERGLLRISLEHWLPIADEAAADGVTMVLARQVTAGMQLLLATDTGAMERSRVTRVDSLCGYEQVVSPVTGSGRLAVDGVVVSCYSGDVLEPSVAHLTFAPLRLLLRACPALFQSATAMQTLDSWLDTLVGGVIAWRGTKTIANSE